MTDMNTKPKYLLVDANVLPDVFLKVVAAKSLLACGKAKTTSQAAQMVGISRSAFYKYKDSVFTQGASAADSMLTLTATLSDEPGVLSRFTSELYSAGANILTVNQNIPVDGVALVSVSARSDNLKMETGELLQQLKRMEGIVDVRLISGR